MNHACTKLKTLRDHVKMFQMSNSPNSFPMSVDMELRRRASRSMLVRRHKNHRTKKHAEYKTLILKFCRGGQCSGSCKCCISSKSCCISKSCHLEISPHDGKGSAALCIVHTCTCTMYVHMHYTNSIVIEVVYV